MKILFTDTNNSLVTIPLFAKNPDRPQITPTSKFVMKIAWTFPPWILITLAMYDEQFARFGKRHGRKTNAHTLKSYRYTRTWYSPEPTRQTTNTASMQRNGTGTVSKMYKTSRHNSRNKSRRSIPQQDTHLKHRRRTSYTWRQWHTQTLLWVIQHFSKQDVSPSLRQAITVRHNTVFNPSLSLPWV